MQWGNNMEAGYDYSLLGGRPRRRNWLFPALAVFIVGAVLLSSAGAYFSFATDAQADQASVEPTGAGQGAPAVEPAEPPDAAAGANRQVPAPPEAIAGQELYPAGVPRAENWVNPLSYEP